MFDIDRWIEIFATLKGNMFRTIMTAMGIIWGIFMLISMLAAGNGIQNGITHGFADFATNSCFVWPQQTSMAYKGFNRNRWWGIEWKDVEVLKQSIPEIEIISPAIQVNEWRGGSRTVSRNLKQDDFVIKGELPTVQQIDPVTIHDGRFLNSIDIKDSRKVALIGKKVKEKLFSPDENIVGEYIQLQGTYFQVIGWFESNHEEGWGDWQNQWVLLPLTTLQQVYNYDNKLDHLAITSQENIPVSVVEAKVKTILKRNHKIHPDDEAAVGSNNVEEHFLKMKGLFFAIQAIIWFVGICTLFAGAMGVSNIMLVVVKERTKIIGIQRALGAKPKNIFFQIIQESLFLTFIAGFIGLLLGIIIISFVEGIETPTFRNPEVDIGVAILGLIIICISGVLSGLIPAYKALKIKPVEAIKS